MTNYIAIIFSSDEKAHAGLRRLWDLADEGKTTVHGAALVLRDDMGNIRVANKNSDIGTRTAFGVGIGALLGLIAGPIGVAAGIAGATSVGAGTAAGLGALAGGAAGLTAGVITEDRRESAASGSLFALAHGQVGVVAEVSEDWTSIIDEAMEALGGTVYRRENTAVANAAFGAGSYGDYLSPYYAEP